PLDLYTCLVRAWEGFRYKDAWQAMQKRAMAQNFSWDKSAVEYVRLYSEVLGLDYTTQLDVNPPAEIGVKNTDAVAPTVAPPAKA
ncbi:MAG: starch synthase, partial [Cyanobacteria bacterium P01_H01_bin.58]